MIGAIRLSRSRVETGGRSAARTRACAGSQTGDGWSLQPSLGGPTSRGKRPPVPRNSNGLAATQR